MNVGFIGLGAMGSAMAANLLKAGHTVTVWNRSPAAVQDLVSKGAKGTHAPIEALRGDAVVSILADDAAVSAVFTDELLASLPKGLVHVNMATVSLALAQRLVELHARHGLAYVGAPVFGRAEVAVAGKLNIIAGGSDAAIEKVQPLFDAMGHKTWRVGPDPVQAHLVKITGNFMIACVIETLAEALTLVEKGRLDPKVFAEIITNTLFAAPVYKIYADLITNKRYEPAAFKMPLGLKDVGLALAAGQATHTQLPLASLVRDHLAEGIAAGDGEKDWAALASVVARKAGLAA